MLIGQYSSKLTDNKRISIPKRFREELGEQMIIAKWYEGCLVLVSKEKWDELKLRLTGEAKLVISPVRDIDRFIMASAFEIGLDSQGRFVLPESLIDYAGIQNEVVFAGLGDRVEVWDLDSWRDLEKLAESKAHQAIELIAKYEKGK